MVREGYRIISDQVGSLPCNENVELSIKKQPIVSNSVLTYRTVKPPASCTAGLSSPPLQNSSSRMPFQFDVATQSPQPNILSGVNATAGGNSLSSPQLLAHNSSFNLQIDNLQQQMRSIQQWWQQSANKFLWLQYQMQLLKHWQEQELVPSTESTVHLGAAASGHDTVPLNGGQRIIRNIESSSCSHITGINGSGPIFSEELMHQLNKLSTSSNLQNNHILGSNDQLFGTLPDGRFAAFPKPNISQGHGFIDRMPTLRNASMLSIANADAATNMRNMFNNHREGWAETSQRLHMVLQRDIRSMAMLGPKKVPRLADQVVSSLPLVPSLHNNLPQLSTQRLNPISMPTSQRMNHGGISGSGSAEVSAWTHGVAGSSNI